MAWLGFGRHYQVLGAQLDTDSFSLSFPLKISLSIPPRWLQLHETAADKHACILCMQNKVLAHKLWNHPLHVSAFTATHPYGPTRDSSCIASPAMDLAACRDACHSERCPNMATIGAIPFPPLGFGSPTRCVWTVYFRGCAKAICTIPNSISLHSPTIASLSRPMAVVSSFFYERFWQCWTDTWFSALSQSMLNHTRDLERVLNWFTMFWR